MKLEKVTLKNMRINNESHLDKVIEIMNLRRFQILYQQEVYLCLPVLHPILKS
jgi:hypothetical protein